MLAAGRKVWRKIEFRCRDPTEIHSIRSIHSPSFGMIICECKSRSSFGPAAAARGDPLEERCASA